MLSLSVLRNKGSGQLVTVLASAATTSVVVQTAGALHTGLDTARPSLQGRQVWFLRRPLLSLQVVNVFAVPFFAIHGCSVISFSFYKDTSPSRGRPYLCSHPIFPAFVKALCPSSVRREGCLHQEWRQGTQASPCSAVHTQLSQIFVDFFSKQSSLGGTWAGDKKPFGFK